jgi:hypothetical protein
VTGIQFRELFIPKQNDMPKRRYDLDWLRVIVFGLLIIYHSGMLYVADWGFHIKSQYQSESLANLMLLLSPWRMAILWIISGIGIRFILAKVSLGRFISLRSIRLLLPLLFAILVIIPPQLYYEMTFNGDLNLSYWEFYKAFFDSNSELFANYQPGIWPHIDVNHLWYLRELWQYSLFIIPLLPLLNSAFIEKLTDKLFNMNAVVAIFLAATPIFIIQMSLDSSRNALGFTFLLYGYLIGWDPVFWQRIKDNCKTLCITALVSYLSLIAFYNVVWLETDTHTNEFLLMVGQLIHGLNRVLCALAVMGLASRYLNKNSKQLSYLSSAVYPYYIVHQTIIIAAGFELSKYSLGIGLEATLVILITIAGCIASFELIRRVELLRVVFGVRLKNHYAPNIQKVGYITAALVIIPFALEILF